MLNIYGERRIAMWIYWQRGVLFNPKWEFCMIHAPLFCGNVYIGIPWVLSHPRVIAFNKGPVMFCFESARPLLSVGLVGLCLDFLLLVCVVMCFLVK